MSIRVMTKVFAHSDSKLATRLVLLALADAASDDGVAWLAQDTIAVKAKVRESTVRSCLRDLEKMGEVQTRKAKRGRSRINVYLVAMPGLAPPDYDRLPFTLESPFDDRGYSAVVEEGDDRGITAATTAESLTAPARAILSGEPSVNRGEANASPEHAPIGPPPLMMVEGRHLGFDALAEACGIAAHDGNRVGEIAAALNGSRGVKVGIRTLAWGEVVAGPFHGDEVAAARASAEDPTRFERAVAAMVVRRAEQYQKAMPGAMLTPTALAKWWLSLETLAAKSPPGLTPDQMEAQDG